MPSTKNFDILREQVLARPGASGRLAEMRAETLAEIGAHSLRERPEWPLDALAAWFGDDQAAVPQTELPEDMTVSRLRRRLRRFGAELRLVAVFDDGDDETEVEIAVGDRKPES